MSIERNVFVKDINENYIYEPNIGDIVFLDGVWLCESVVDKIQKLNNGHTLIHLEALGPGAYSGWFNKDKVLIHVYPRTSWTEIAEYNEPVFVNGKSAQIQVPEYDIGVLNDLYGWSSKEMIDKYIRGGRNYEQ